MDESEKVVLVGEEYGYSPDVYDIELSPLETAFLYIERAGKVFPSEQEILAANYQIFLPFYGKYPLTQKFKKTTHPAYDWAVPMRTPLYNPFPHKAQVSFVGYTTGYAYNVRLLDKEYNLMSLLAHCPADGLKVKVGDWVNPLQFVALSDNTGNSTGAHVHMEIRIPPFNRGYADCIDFWAWLEALPTVMPEPPAPAEKRYINIHGVHVNGKTYTGKLFEE